MRFIHVMALLGLLVVVGVVLSIARRPALVSPAPDQLTSSESAAPYATTPPTPPVNVPPWGHAARPEAALACIQDALGGVKVFAGVASLRIVGTTTVTTTTGFRPVASRREIGVVFPNRYRLSNAQTDAPAGHAPSTSVSGFDGRKPATNAARRGLVREIMMRFPRKFDDVRQWVRMTVDTGKERLAIDVSGLDGLDVTLLADARTCLPVAFESHEVVSGTSGSSDMYRIDLSEYRRVGGILFPTVLKTTKNGAPWEEERDSDIQVNPPLDDEYFRVRGRG